MSIIFVTFNLFFFQDIGESDIEQLKKKTHFNRMRHKSLHVLAVMQRDPIMRKNLSQKQILKKEVAKSRFRKIVSKVVMDNTDGKRKISDITQHIVNKRRNEIAEEALENIRESSPEVQRHVIQVHSEGMDDPNYANIDELQNKAGGTLEKPVVPKTDDSSDSDGEIDKSPKLEIPKVENDVWPEEDHYTVADDVDVLF